MKNKQLVVSVVIASALLTFINYYSLKITSSVRAYVNGESRYSKGQKDGARHLITYLAIEEENYWRRFEEELKVPIGDSLARTGLMYDSSYQFIKAGFLMGKNHPADIDNMIWLFTYFQDTYFLKDAIQLWKEADVLVGQLKNLGDEVHPRLKELSQAERDRITMKVDLITTQLTVKERAFSDLLGANARSINELLFMVNLGVTLIIITSVVSFAYKEYHQLLHAKNELNKTNSELIMINHDLDNFIYIASHDLKSPINNLEGLITLFKLEGNLNPTCLELLDKMDQSIYRLRNNINALTDVIKADKSPLDDMMENSFEDLLNEFKLENSYLFREAGITIADEFKIDKINFSRNGLRSIMQNLLTNAIKYRSASRSCKIDIKTYRQDDRIILQVSDNGLGMDLEQNGNKLFKMFQRLHDHVEGTGVGLYIIKRIVEKHGGSISVKSQLDTGTDFYLNLSPLANLTRSRKSR